MTATRSCDHCTNVAPDHDRDWLRVERDGYAFITFGESEGPYDFCSMRCLAQWATNHINGTRPITITAGAVNG